MLSVEDWAEIRRLHRAEGLPIKAIARLRGISRNTVRAAVASDGPPKYERKRTRGQACELLNGVFRQWAQRGVGHGAQRALEAAGVLSPGVLRGRRG